MKAHLSLQTHQSLPCLHTESMDKDEDSNQNLEKYQNLIYSADKEKKHFSLFFGISDQFFVEKENEFGVSIILISW